MVEIIPAIMPNNYDDLLQKAGRVRGIVPVAQIDVMDGVFVPGVSWPYDKAYDKGGAEQFRTMVESGDTLPFCEDMAYEIDLMVAHPEKVVADWVLLGAHRILVHIESIKNPREVLSIMKNILKEEEAQDENYEVHTPLEFGIAIGAETPLERLTPYIHDVDVVQCMGIKKIGYQGEPFDEDVIERIKSLRAQHPHLIISVDGGVNFESAPRLINAGATRLVSGSTIFESSDIRDTILKLTHTNMN